MKKTFFKAVAATAVVAVTMAVSSVAAFAMSTFDATTLACAADKEQVEANEVSAPFGISGEVLKRDSKKGTATSVEVGKANTGAITVTVDGAATITVSASSTGGSNTSSIGIMDESEILDQTTVTGTTAVNYSYEVSKAGTYRVMSPEDDNNRGVRIYSVQVVPATETLSIFDATTLACAADKEQVEADEVSAPFGISGEVLKRDSKKGTATSVEVGKANTGAITVTVNGAATITVSASSTGGSNTSSIGIMDESNVLDQTTVTGTTAVNYSYEVSKAGTYRVMSPEDDNNRGVRIYSVSVLEKKEESTLTNNTYNGTSGLVVVKDSKVYAIGKISIQDIAEAADNTVTLSVGNKKFEKQEVVYTAVTVDGEKVTEDTADTYYLGVEVVDVPNDAAAKAIADKISLVLA